jgi:hypothetical protein
VWPFCGPPAVIMLDPVACPDSVEPALVVEIYDDGTGLPAADGATGWVRDGDYVDELRPHEFLGTDEPVLVSLSAADERPGRYDVSVEKAGYERWTRTDVRVRSGVCNVRTVRLRADLVPAT